MIFVKRVLATKKAADLIDILRDRHGELIFHLSGGCCDGSAPMCFPEGELKIGDNDICLGVVHECGFYISRFQYNQWKQTQITLDVVEGRGSSFSLEIPLGFRFIIELKLLTDEALNIVQSIENK